ncbi:dihydrolipoyl dehydrogenase [Mycobacterium sp. ACS4331]|uniref:dihydrolipoyl dehydrogenase n=1 Tax=Mycobacterium sp. ACS4331 TaxID=1834121 RepID=UPI0007FFBE67|nr:dihydrolipoyl dehydrogenase [Mycobacterium sp. ACS4331]OBF13730.1 dihydrolipoyl dehydrogenase [Mycobacterium sp. ACS4331]
MSDYDIAVLGGGSGGYATALRASQLNLRVALVERDRLGGTCLHSGCIPTKAFVHAAEIAESARQSHLFGIKSSFEGVDAEGLHAFKDGVVNRLHAGLQGLVTASPNITLVQGAGRLVSRGVVEVDETRVTADNIVLATGSRANVPAGLSLGPRVITSEEALSLTDVPERVVIIGGSVIGVEFASIWKSFGSDVTIIEAMPTLVPLEDPMLSKGLERAFRKRKIAFKTGVRCSGIEHTDDGVAVSLSDGESIHTDLVLIAVGRVPASAGLGLEECGVVLDRGWVRTDERLATSVPGIFAVGDLVPGLQLAHRGFAHGIFVAEEIAGLAPEPVVDSSIPRVTYCEPELASVGLTENQAAERYGPIETIEYNLGGNGKSQILRTAGMVKLVRKKDGPIVGVHMIGSRLGEQVGEASLLVNLNVLPEDVAHLVHAHPTQNESLGEALMAIAGMPLHTHA